MASFLVSPQWLHNHLVEDRVCLVDCRFSLADPQWGRQQYEASHIPGAYYLDLNRDLSGPVGQHGGRHPLPDLELLVQTLESLGIQSGSSSTAATRVVAYDDSNFAFAARLWWLLRYLGHDQVAVLDGGWPAWQAQGYPVTQAIPAARSGTFLSRIRSDWVVDMRTVKSNRDQVGNLLIDSRAPERYRGEVEPIDPVAGHIPGAVNYPWQQVVTAEGTLRLPEDLQQYWSALSTANTVTVYCGSGVTACVNLLAIAMAELPMGKLYAGSWSDWCSYKENPINP